jgi:DNA replication protein DnaD
MEDKIFLLLKVTIKTSYKDTQQAIKELQTKTLLNVSSTKNVKVLKTEIMQLKTKTL